MLRRATHSKVGLAVALARPVGRLVPLPLTVFPPRPLCTPSQPMPDADSHHSTTPPTCIYTVCTAKGKMAFPKVRGR